MTGAPPDSTQTLWIITFDSRPSAAATRRALFSPTWQSIRTGGIGVKSSADQTATISPSMSTGCGILPVVLYAVDRQEAQVWARCNSEARAPSTFQIAGAARPRTRDVVVRTATCGCSASADAGDRDRPITAIGYCRADVRTRRPTRFLDEDPWGSASTPDMRQAYRICTEHETFRPS